MALAREIERSLAGEIYISCRVRVVPSCLVLKEADGGLEIVVVIDGNAAESVYYLLKAAEVDAEIVVYIYIEQLCYRVHAALNSVDTGMSELILGTVCFRQRKLDVVVAGDGYEQHVLGLGVYDGENVRVAAALFDKVSAARVDTAHIYGENAVGIAGVGGLLDVGLVVCFIRNDSYRVYLTQLAAEILEALYVRDNVDIRRVEKYSSELA